MFHRFAASSAVNAEYQTSGDFVSKRGGLH
jgi:hypothetical protein